MFRRRLYKYINQMARLDPPTTIIGAGAVGTAIGEALLRKGYPIVSVISKTLKSARTLAKRLDCPIASNRITSIPAITRLIVVAVPDPIIPEIDHALASHPSLPFRRLLAFHTSGVLPASVLEHLSHRGSGVAAIHPIQTFPRHSTIPTQALDGIYFGVDCPKKVLPGVRKVVSDLKGEIVVIPPDLRPLYHAACVFSSSYSIVLLQGISAIGKKLGMGNAWYDVFGPLMKTATENMIRQSPAEALTGPILRVDLQTLASHRSSLTTHAPELLPLYVAFGKETARIARKSRRITPRQYNAIVRVLENR